MSSYDKVVKLACKPKAAPPKPKYLEPIIAATWANDGAIHDVCKALSPRFREPNSIVVFKALIVLHSMIRNGATDNVLSYLSSSSEVLRLQNVSSGNWEGYITPQNLQHYSQYLDARIHAYRDLKHDAIHVQSESNRDWRNSNSIEEDASRGRRNTKPKPTTPGSTRNKSIAGKKLRLMSVEKGLLRETKVVQRMIDALVECRFYLDDLEDGLTTTALRMLVNDLLILFQAGNEGVINVLEHYFEMSYIDAKDALAIYRHFCDQTERVVEYLSIAKKLQNILTVPIPNLKHAPVSLAGSLQEYLDDPNFERNRIEYKTSKDAERNPKNPEGSFNATKIQKDPAPPLSTTPSTSISHAKTKSQSNHAVVDFLSAIEEEQPTMFNPQTDSPSGAYFQQQAAANPFVSLQMTSSQPPASHSIVLPPITSLTQPGSLLASQHIPIQTNPTMLQPPQPQSGHRPFSSFLPPQATGTQLSPPMMGGTLQARPTDTIFLQPQATGPNPFRQSVVLPHSTGMGIFGVGDSGRNIGQVSLAGTGLTTAPPIPSTSSSSPFAPPLTPWYQPAFSSSNVPARPASTPLTSRGLPSHSSLPSPPTAQPMKPHLTGSRNPFAPSATAAPPVPKPPTLMELGMLGSRNGTNMNESQAGQRQPQSIGSIGIANGSSGWGASDMAGVASSFSFSGRDEEHKTGSIKTFFPGNSTQITPTTAEPTSSLVSASPLPSSQRTDGTSISTASTAAYSPTTKSQSGFIGLKAFKPTSSFGAMLLESLPPLPESSPDNSSGIGNSPPPGTGGLSGGIGVPQLSLAAVSQPTGFAGLGQAPDAGLRPQPPGLGAANPFRLSTMAPPNGLIGNFGDPKSQLSTLSPYNATTSVGFPSTNTLTSPLALGEPGKLRTGLGAARDLSQQ